jgi:hypothetical protein
LGDASDSARAGGNNLASHGDVIAELEKISTPERSEPLCRFYQIEPIKITGESGTRTRETGCLFSAAFASTAEDDVEIGAFFNSSSCSPSSAAHQRRLVDMQDLAHGRALPNSQE